MTPFDTIAAISTPPGKGGIAVIRVSGNDAAEVSRRVAVPVRPGIVLCESPRTAVYCNFYSDGHRIDDGLVTFFAAPASYTGEDTVEICCHGGVLLTQTLLSAVFAAGARPAQPGEFTRRAFVAGKLTLTRAEAVAGLIDAETPGKLRLMSAQARGLLGDRIESLAAELKTLLAEVYVNIDYPDEQLAGIDAPQLSNRITALISDTSALLDTYRAGRAVCEGIPTAIVGEPNAGKSSLLNRLLNRDRAIVTALPGTTRDTIEETASVGGVMLRLSDTAGIRDGGDEPELLGIGRAVSALRSAELLLAVFDSAAPSPPADSRLMTELRSFRGVKIAVLNKSDLPTCSGFSLPGIFDAEVSVSAVTGKGIDALGEVISHLWNVDKISPDDSAVVTSARQSAALTVARDRLVSAADALAAGFTQDIVGGELEAALASLLEADAREAAGAVADEIFSHFCVGK